MTKIIKLNESKNSFAEKQRKINKLFEEVDKLREVNSKINGMHKELYQQIWHELYYRKPEKIIIKKGNWYCPFCELPIDNESGYVMYCDFCGKAIITPRNEFKEEIE